MRVTHPTREELKDRRRRLLEQARVSSSDELAARAERGALSGDEFWLWEDIQSIDFLLGEQTPPDGGA
ncbi:MAG: hypothetical protein ACRD0K_00735 [Egibacteraceae bacterium]